MDEETTRLIGRMTEAKESAWSSVKWNRVGFALLTIFNIAAGAITAASSGAVIVGLLGEASLPIVAGTAGIISFMTAGALNAFRIKDAAVDAARAAAEVEGLIELVKVGLLPRQAGGQQYVDVINKYPTILGGYRID